MGIMTQNRKLAFCIGFISTIGGWYSLLLLTQTRIMIEERHIIGLVLALMGYILWFFKFSYTIKSH